MLYYDTGNPQFSRFSYASVIIGILVFIADFCFYASVVKACFINVKTYESTYSPYFTLLTDSIGLLRPKDMPLVRFLSEGGRCSFR